MNLEYKSQDLIGIFTFYDLDIVGCSVKFDEDLKKAINKLSKENSFEVGKIKKKKLSESLRIFYPDSNFIDISICRNYDGKAYFSATGFDHNLNRNKLHEIIKEMEVNVQDIINAYSIDLISNNIFKKEIDFYNSARRFSTLTMQDFHQVYGALRYWDFLFKSKRIQLDKSVALAKEKYGVEIL